MDTNKNTDGKNFVQDNPSDSLGDRTAILECTKNDPIFIPGLYIQRVIFKGYRTFLMTLKKRGNNGRTPDA